MFGNTFHGKRVFLTGHTGFKGSWLTLWLNLLGAEVKGFSLEPPSTPSMFELLDMDRDFRGIKGDIRDLKELKAAMHDARPELVVHMAAQPLVRRSYREPVETFTTNVLGTVNVLEAVRSTPTVRGVINVTSDKCYENREQGHAFRETDPMGGNDPYSASKGCAELAAHSWNASFFEAKDVILASVRAGNVIGGGDFGEDRLLPDMVRAFSLGEPVSIRSPKAIRPWQHVLEPLSGYLTLARAILNGDRKATGGWNFGPSGSDTLTVGEIADRFAGLWPGTARIQADADDHPHEAQVLHLDCAKVRERFDWLPRTDVTTALKWTSEWYAAWSTDPTVLMDLTRAQIRQYEGIR
ncbi:MULTISPECIES: CDP-glucose 4,6-dehydratase [unclassified Pseudodesulfovibrio]|uniref:CDP-glucose 4,6-dehydratase n=1 Tax=unclassified Pseudodesulfovibrio TaxID=2661612 RepID=UPI000FEC1890|nr:MULTISPECIES: CDP-glucose 4,6-dehydratase [unclassified Pseudodesulfovibrio]MCJ2163211.1 CDP-glucose 4,6-dehydratase [Pseudodesulfovibrio sp. S3-i]RWU07194.1 CDP-glucose 4,6-dehydratase [Pseudodesulfovibrio sp. S3]